MSNLLLVLFINPQEIYRKLLYVGCFGLDFYILLVGRDLVWDLGFQSSQEMLQTLFWGIDYDLSEAVFRVTGYAVSGISKILVQLIIYVSQEGGGYGVVTVEMAEVLFLKLMMA